MDNKLGKPQDRVTAVGSDSYSYNDNGETTSKTVGGTTNNFAYTYEGMIDYYNTGGSNQVDFGYDALGRRVYRNAGGVSTRYYYDGSKVLQESQAGTITATYAYGNGLLRKDGEFPLFDGQGNERTVTNSSQTVTGTINYDAFGNTVGSTGSSASSYMYGADSGYRSDGDAGLTYIAARYYDSKIGRFTTRDTYLDQKPYLYCENDPVNCFDPSGHENPELVNAGNDIGIVAVIIGGGISIAVGVGVTISAPALAAGGAVVGTIAVVGGVIYIIGRVTDPIVNISKGFDPRPGRRRQDKLIFTPSLITDS